MGHAAALEALANAGFTSSSHLSSGSNGSSCSSNSSSMYEGKEDPSNGWSDHNSNGNGDLASLEIAATELDEYVQERAATSSRAVAMDNALQRLDTRDHNCSESKEASSGSSSHNSTSSGGSGSNIRSGSDEIAAARQFLSKVEACKQHRDDVIERAISQLEASQVAQEADLKAQHAAAEASLRRQHEALLEVCVRDRERPLGSEGRIQVQM